MVIFLSNEKLCFNFELFLIKDVNATFIDLKNQNTVIKSAVSSNRNAINANTVNIAKLRGKLIEFVDLLLGLGKPIPLLEPFFAPVIAFKNTI